MTSIPYKKKNRMTVNRQEENAANANSNTPAAGFYWNEQNEVTPSPAQTRKKNTPSLQAQKQKTQPQQTQTPQGTGGSTNDPYIAQANALYQQMMNRGAFSYDLQGDMLYRQYADQYRQMGRQAMQDTMGYASGQTGGYNSSWGQTLGHQAYQGYMSQLNAMIPDFYDRAYQAYLDEGDRLMEQYQLALQHPGYIAAVSGSGSGSGTGTEEPISTLIGMSGDAMQGIIDKINAQKGMSVTTQKVFGGGPITGVTLTPETYVAAVNAALQPDFNYYDDYYKKILEQTQK